MATTHKLGYHTNEFSKKVTLMNQTGSKSMTLTADQARSLHSEMIDMLAKIVQLSDVSESRVDVVIAMDGGKF